MEVRTFWCLLYEKNEAEPVKGFRKYFTIQIKLILVLHSRYQIRQQVLEVIQQKTSS